MEYADVKEWLDILVEKFKEATQKRYLTPRITAVASLGDKIVIFEEIDVIADIMGLELKEEIFHSNIINEDYYRYLFDYNGVKFSQATEKRLESFACRDREQNGCR